MIDKVFNKYKTNTRAVQSFWALAQVGAERERERERERVCSRKKLWCLRYGFWIDIILS